LESKIPQNGDSIPLWMRNVISLCHAKGGKITSEEIANAAAMVKRYTKLGWVLVNNLRQCKHICVEVIGEETNERGHKIKVYRVTRREVSVSDSEVVRNIFAIDSEFRTRGQ
jgi:hypothetical protein